MSLVLFDIDGTLTHSQSIDSELYLRSLAAVFGFTEIRSDWSAYRHTTDSGILAEIFEERMQRAPTPQEAAGFRAHFVGAIAATAAREPFREIAGAARILHRLAAEESLGIGLATGGFGESARCKMMSAGLEYDRFPAASADDALARIEIMRLAAERVRARMGPRSGCGSERFVYIGDAIWDARACRELGVPFIGIAQGSAADALVRAGARAVFADFRDADAFCAALTAALAQAGAPLR
ncbi:MAG TPA: HAD family hydrolase [Steroidobacteraceae bacterium]|nr:HAD family hydrolase [Steroidobacteraceae bacterium]